MATSINPDEEEPRLTTKDRVSSARRGINTEVLEECWETNDAGGDGRIVAVREGAQRHKGRNQEVVTICLYFDSHGRDAWESLLSLDGPSMTSGRLPSALFPRTGLQGLDF